MKNDNHEKNTDEYFVFISYSSKDVRMAQWLQHELEQWHLPAKLNGRPRRDLRKVFRDRTELSAGELGPQIESALNNSTHLVVICSPNSAKSEWVDLEIQNFIKLHNLNFDGNDKNKILPYIIEGNNPDEYFTETLKKLQNTGIDILGGDINKDGGNDAAFIKVVAGMLNLPFDTLWQRFAREKAEKEQKEQEKKEKLLRLQSRFVSEKSISLSKSDSYVAALLALDVLPRKIDTPNRPFVTEAEAALRTATRFNNVIFKGHKGDIHCVSYNKDYSLIVSASEDKTIKIWDVSIGICIKTLAGHLDRVNSVYFSPNSKYIVSTSDDCMIKIWEVDSGNCVRTLYGHQKKVYSAHYSPDGDLISSVSFDGTLKLWNANTGHCINTIEMSKKGIIYRATINSDNSLVVTPTADSKVLTGGAGSDNVDLVKRINKDCISSAISPDGKIIVSSDNTNIKIWDVVTGGRIKTIDAPSDNICTIKVSGNGRYIITMSVDCVIKIWDSETGQCLRIIKGEYHDSASNIRWWDEVNNKWVSVINYQKNWAYSCAFSPDGKKVITPSYDGTIKIWDVNIGECIQILNANICRCPGSASFSNDGKLIVSGSSKSIRIWDCESMECIKTFMNCPSDIYSVRFSLNDKMILSTSSDNTVCLWDVETGNCLKTYEGGADSAGNASFGNTNILYSLGDFVIKKQEIDLLNSLKTIDEYPGAVHCVSYSPNGNMIVSISDNRIYILDAINGNIIKTLGGHKTRIIRAYFVDDNQIISFAEYKNVKFWNIHTGECVKSVVSDLELKFATASPNGKYLVIPDGNTLVHLLNLHTKEVLKTFIGHIKSVYFASFSPNGRYLLTCSNDKTIRKWNVKTGKCVLVLEGHADSVHSALFNIQGTKIVSASSDKTIKIWGAKSGICLQTIEGHSDGVLYAAFNPNGNRIASASLDGTVKIWSFLSLQELIDSTKERFKSRQLTKEERRQYYLE